MKRNSIVVAGFLGRKIESEIGASGWLLAALCCPSGPTAPSTDPIQNFAPTVQALVLNLEDFPRIPSRSQVVKNNGHGFGKNTFHGGTFACDYNLADSLLGAGLCDSISRIPAAFLGKIWPPEFRTHLELTGVFSRSGLNVAFDEFFRSFHAYSFVASAHWLQNCGCQPSLADDSDTALTLDLAAPGDGRTPHASLKPASSEPWRGLCRGLWRSCSRTG